MYSLATRMRLGGWVFNSSDGVDIEVEGPSEWLAGFVTALQEESPPLAHIDSISITIVEPQDEHGFSIRASIMRPGASLISPDVAICLECLREVFSPDDRRFRYPFTNCTNCGPRFTIIEGLPYDRPMTTMRVFPMCSKCQDEYNDPLDRRFHAQPNACPDCGPRVWMSSGQSTEVYGDALAAAEDPFQAAASLLRLGGTMAIKGLGGFHLACDATNDQAIRWLRRRKGRPAKPFAVMMTDIEMIRRYCYLSHEEENLLQSPAAPIVLCWQKPGTDLALTVAPRNHALGVMLPYTPLHHILLREVGRPLVMTSGNHTDEPIARNNEDAISELGDITDAFLFHDRPIHNRCDDSVWSVVTLPSLKQHPIPTRRSRGYAPLPIRLGFYSQAPVFSAGAQMKNTFCLLKNNQAFLSQHIGELDNLETQSTYRSAISHLLSIFEVQPVVAAHDSHPDYFSTRYVKEMAAEQSGLTTIPVQHHHAHIASCLADNRVNEPVIGVALDGTGYGSDGKIWGGEFLITDLATFERAGHLEYMPLPGGEAAIRRPYRIAFGYLLTALGYVPELPFLERIDAEEMRILRQQIERRIHCPSTSSCGRLFDAVAALLEVRDVVTYEAQAAIELEMLAMPGVEVNAVTLDRDSWSPYPFEIEVEGNQHLVRLRRLLDAIVQDIKEKQAGVQIGRRFHATVAAIVAEMCMRIRKEHRLNKVALSGGCFQNRLLLKLTVAALQRDGFDVLLHRQIPPNDGGIALGQAVVAAHRFFN